MHELRFRAMGTNVHLAVVDGDPELLEQGRARLEDLEQRWSRFLPDSEISQLNDRAGSGEAVALTTVTVELLAAAIDASDATRGVFDPTILPDLVAAGYDRSFELGQTPRAERDRSASSRGARAIDLDIERGTARLPAGCAVDLGGIGKGRASDLVIEELLEAEPGGLCVNLGGDLRVAGAAPEDAPAWAVAIDDPFDPSGETDLCVVGLADGALATSSTMKRRWTDARGRTRHHLIDPRTGEPSTTELASVSVIAGSAMIAEIHAKATLISGQPTDPALPMLFVTVDGEQQSVAGFDDFVW